MKKNLTLLTSFVIGGVILLTGCGGQALDSGSSESESSTGTHKNVVPPGDLAAPVLEAISVDDALAARVPEDIVANGLNVATADGYPPMEMFDADGKTMIGVDMSLARAMGNLWGVEVNIQNSDVNSMLPGVVSGRYDVVISGLNDTAVRREKATFVDYAKSSAAIVVKKGNPEGIATPMDLCGKTVAVLDNGYYMQQAQAFSKECTDAGSPEITIMGFANDPEALLQVTNGRAQAGMNDYPVAAYRATHGDEGLEPVEIPGGGLFGVAVDPKNEEFISLIQDTLQQMADDGQYQAIFDAWDLSGMTLPTVTVNQGE